MVVSFFFPCVFYYLYLSPMYVEQGSMVYLCCEEALLVFVPMTVMYVSLCMHVLCVHCQGFSIRPLQVILWFLVHRPHQILFLDFYLIIGFLSHYFYYACAEWSMWYKIV